MVKITANPDEIIIAIYMTMTTQNSTQAPEIITVPADTDEVRCDGGGGALGHPLVWYVFNGNSQVRCGYCDRLFVKDGA